MPLGSSSEAPVIRPGPRTRAKRRHQLTFLSRLGPSNGTGRSEEVAQQIEEHVQPIVMHPMPGALDRHDPGVPEMPQAAVLLRVLRPAFFAVDQEGRAADA